jgi:hypothetical protein
VSAGHNCEFVVSFALIVASTVVLAAAVSPASGATQSRPWLDRALKLQYEFSGDVGLRNAPSSGPTTPITASPRRDARSAPRDRVMRACKQVIIVGNTPCGIGSGRLSKVLDWEAHGETRLVDLS